jgi:hypothetical protein
MHNLKYILCFLVPREIIPMNKLNSVVGFSASVSYKCSSLQLYFCYALEKCTVSVLKINLKSIKHSLFI